MSTSVSRRQTDNNKKYDALRTWAKIGCLSFGGPAAQIALMQRMLVEEKAWLSEKDYLNALSFCMLLPGPEAMQLATYVGWKRNGTIGGLIAGTLFVLPGALVVLMLASIYVLYGQVPIIAALFLGIKAAVIIIVVHALLRLANKALDRALYWLIAAFAFVGLFFLNIPYPLIILVAAIIGYFAGGHAPAATASDATPLRFNAKQTILTVTLWAFLWWAPLVLLLVMAGSSFLSDLGLFFSRLAVVTFGGAYAVLAYLAQDVVTQYGWLNAAEMMDGLGLAETTPGPLILVTEFVGFVAGFKQGDWPLALASTALTLWVTFVPCFLWIFVGAPYLDWICRQRTLQGALAAITAAVVGVILNLSLWFAMHVFFTSVQAEQRGIFTLWLPDWTSLDWRVLVLTAFCALLHFALRVSIVNMLVIAALAGGLLVTLTA